jgi:hypothetical protein
MGEINYTLKKIDLMDDSKDTITARMTMASGEIVNFNLNVDVAERLGAGLLVRTGVLKHKTGEITE